MYVRLYVVVCNVAHMITINVECNPEYLKLMKKIEKEKQNIQISVDNVILSIKIESTCFLFFP